MSVCMKLRQGLGHVVLYSGYSQHIPQRVKHSKEGSYIKYLTNNVKSHISRVAECHKVAEIVSSCRLVGDIPSAKAITNLVLLLLGNRITEIRVGIIQ